MRRKLTAISILIVSLILILPAFPADATGGDGSFRYISTETGTKIKHINGHEYNVVDRRTNFNRNESVLALTKVSNIYRVGAFRFEYDLYGLDNNIRRTVYSNTFYPQYQNWPVVISSWNYFDNLPNGRYEFKTFIILDNGGRRHLDTKQFSVGSGSYYEPAYSVKPTRHSKYGYSWTKADSNVRHVSGYIYDVTNPRYNFNDSEKVYFLTRMSDMYDINNFRIKHELYDTSGRLINTSESPYRRPDYNYWEYNYYYSDFNRLSNGNYTVKVFISVNNGNWELLDSKNFSVASYNRNQNYDSNYSSYGGSYNGINNYRYDSSYRSGLEQNYSNTYNSGYNGGYEGYRRNNYSSGYTGNYQSTYGDSYNSGYGSYRTSSYGGSY